MCANLAPDVLGFCLVLLQLHMHTCSDSKALATHPTYICVYIMHVLIMAHLKQIEGYDFFWNSVQFHILTYIRAKEFICRYYEW